MSLPTLMQANENYGKFNFINEMIIDDGYGGYTEGYKVGAEFEAVIVLDDSVQAQRAEKDGLKGVYTLTTDTTVPLKWHKILRRQKDNAIYRVTSKDEHATPSTTTLNLREVKVEEYTLSGEVAENG